MSPCTRPTQPQRRRGQRLELVALARWLGLGLLLCGGTACSAEPVDGADASDTTDAAVAADCHVTAPTEPTGAPLAAGADVELVFGFQGFVWADLVAVLPGAPVGKIAKVPYSYEIHGLEPKSSLLTTTFDAKGRAPLRLLLSPSDVKLLAGRDVTLSVKVMVGPLVCTVVQSARLVDANPCVHVDDSKPCAGRKLP